MPVVERATMRHAWVGLAFATAAGVFSSGAWAQEKPQSFEAALESATFAGGPAELARLVDPLFADCKRDDDVAQRSCTNVRDFLVQKLRAEVYWAVGDEAALVWAPYDPSEKKVQLEVHGCLACVRPLDVDGKPRFVTTRVPKAIKQGRAVGLDVGFHEVAQPDEKAAAAFQEKMKGRLRVQFVFRVGPVWRSGGFEGVTFVPIAHRVFDRCTGKVLASEPPSAADAQPMRDDTCPEELSEEAQRKAAWEARPVQLTPKQINATMAKVKSKIADCGQTFDVSGTATVKLLVDQEGRIEQLDVLAPYDKAPVGYCVRAAMKGLTFPPFKGEKMTIPYPFRLR